jgi:hypothetical protein
MPTIDDCVQISADRKTVWVHADDGSTVGRFSKVFGMDVHTTITAQRQGAAECLKCTHARPGLAEWLEFCDLIQAHYGITVDRGLMTFETEGGGHAQG